MPSTYVSLYYHFVFSTKDRRRSIKDSLESRLYPYLGGILRNLGGVALSIGGDADHVHLLASLKPTHRVSEVLQTLKANSSGWIHKEMGIHSFDWQNGYGAFTVGKFESRAVQEYIEKQKEHHRRKTFQEEYRELLQEHGVEFDERYLW
ncbi:MAG: IS200/IS605 family transposase [Acidobacteriota bacterium]|nr:IS200/IS605 family transposase [Acidobacteriota bacterium]